MPVIAQIMIPVRFGEGTVEILREKINKCGCLDLVTESKRLNTPIDELRRAIATIEGVSCNDSGVCCAPSVTNFAEKLRRFREDS